MKTHEARLGALREHLAHDALAGPVLPLTDEHLSEYVGAYAGRLAWLTGFLGSAGSAVVLAREAAIFTDGRYTLQVRDQVDAAHWSYQALPETSVAAWLGEHAPEGARIGYDPWLHTRSWVDEARAALAARDAELVAVRSNPIDAIWTDRPAPSGARLVPHALEHAGKSSAEKRQDMADALREQKADAAVLSALDSIAWTFNIRGSDVDRTPVALAFALVHEDGTADLFVDPGKIDDAVARHLGNGVRLHPRHAFADHLATLGGKTVVADPERAGAAIFEALDAAGARVLAKRDPAVLPKAIKNPAEIAGHRAAQLRDGTALTRFLRWLPVEARHGGLDELSAAAKLASLREDTGCLVDQSFDTISGAGSNGAIMHYRVSEATNRAIEQGTLYLVDSGAQYRDGTTDVTRTLAIGDPTPEMRDRYTRVLQGHIAIARAVFPDGTRGSQIDAFARAPLWSAGLDYAHGTGHGVGSFLSVHEGPQRIAKSAGGQAGTEEPLRAGMILSNEPGYYKPGAYGIRIENLVLVEPRDIAGAEGVMLGFETLTFAPFDRALIAVGMLSAGERAWVDSYHRDVGARIGPQLDDDDRKWLDAACAPLETA